MSLYADSSKQLLHELLRLTKKNNTAIGYQKLTVDGTVKALTVPATATYALITLESSIATEAIRYLELGTVTPPSSTDGISKLDNAMFEVVGAQNLSNFRVTQAAAGTHTLHIQYYK
jgi:hypothetical protein